MTSQLQHRCAARSSLSQAFVAGVVIAGLAVAWTPGVAYAGSPTPRITLRTPDLADAHSRLILTGRLVNTGSRNNKSVILQRRASGNWIVASRLYRQDDGRYRFVRTMPATGPVTFRTKVVRSGDGVLARSAPRTVFIRIPPPAPTPTTSPTPSPPAASIPPELVRTWATGSSTDRYFIVRANGTYTYIFENLGVSLVENGTVAVSGDQLRLQPGGGQTAKVWAWRVSQNPIVGTILETYDETGTYWIWFPG